MYKLIPWIWNASIKWPNEIPQWNASTYSFPKISLNVSLQICGINTFQGALTYFKGPLTYPCIFFWPPHQKVLCGFNSVWTRLTSNFNKRNTFYCWDCAYLNFKIFISFKINPSLFKSFSKLLILIFLKMKLSRGLWACSALG